MNKELLIKEGKELKEVAENSAKIKKMMDKAINDNGIISSRETADQMICAALTAETEVQELINYLNAEEADRKKAIMYFVGGYTGK